jgi:sec-independent protein translocase protein TatA
MLPNLGPTELILILLVVLLLFGGKKIPEIAKNLAHGIREFRKASSDVEKGLKEEKKPIEGNNKEEEQK